MPTIIVVNVGEDENFDKVFKSVTDSIGGIKTIKTTQDSSPQHFQKFPEEPAKEPDEKQHSEIDNRIELNRMALVNSIKNPDEKRFANVELIKNEERDYIKKETRFLSLGSFENRSQVMNFMRNDNPLFGIIDKDYVIQRRFSKTHVKYILGEIMFLLSRKEYVCKEFFIRRYRISASQFLNICANRTFQSERPVDITRRRLEKADARAVKMSDIMKQKFQKVSDQQREEIIKLIGIGKTLKEVSQITNIAPYLISNIYKIELRKAGLSKANREAIIKWASSFSVQRNV